jgi:hypothetical protein
MNSSIIFAMGFVLGGFIGMCVISILMVGNTDE